MQSTGNYNSAVQRKRWFMIRRDLRIVVLFPELSVATHPPRLANANRPGSPHRTAGTIGGFQKKATLWNRRQTLTQRSSTQPSHISCNPLNRKMSDLHFLRLTSPKIPFFESFVLRWKRAKVATFLPPMRRHNVMQRVQSNIFFSNRTHRQNLNPKAKARWRHFPFKQKKNSKGF